MATQRPERKATIYSPEDEQIIRALTSIMEPPAVERSATNAAGGGGGGGGGVHVKTRAEYMRDAEYVKLIDQNKAAIAETPDSDAHGVLRKKLYETNIASLEQARVEAAKQRGETPAEPVELPAELPAHWPFTATAIRIRELGMSALTRIRAYRDLDVKAQFKFWCEVMPAALTTEVFKRLFANFEEETGTFTTTFNVKDAVNESGPAKTEDVQLIKPLADPADEEYEVRIRWMPLRVIKADFQHKFMPCRAWNYQPTCFRDPILGKDGVLNDAVATDVFRFYFPAGLQRNALVNVHPSVMREAKKLFKTNGLELDFCQANDADGEPQYLFTQMMVLEGRRTMEDWRAYWEQPTAGREPFSVTLTPTTGDPAMGTPGYAEALARPGTIHTTSIAEREKAEIEAARARVEKEREIAEAAQRTRERSEAAQRAKEAPADRVTEDQRAESAEEVIRRARALDKQRHNAEAESIMNHLGRPRTS